MPSQDEIEQAVKVLNRAINQIEEHFDTVQIFVTRYDSEGHTVNTELGSGNWFARCGQVKDWVETINERTRCEVRMEAMQRPSSEE